MRLGALLSVRLVKAMKIVHAVYSMELGGAEMLVAQLSRMQRDAGHEVSVCAYSKLGPLGEKLGEEGIPFVMVFTKADKQSTAQTKALITDYLAKMSEIWDELPRYFITSAESARGREDVLDFIAEVNQQWRADAAAGA